ncbi:hypothetical protein [Corynebacterium atrinae]|uniref:hypothetical protein n=1 Tax=Corynebacterium atrinae TaxID=1336740 RepID=UPI0025B4F0A9|nr:hypothetical protein [Corynebacterium atrinae]
MIRMRVCVSLEGQPEDCTDLTEEETRSLIAELQAGLAVLEQREPVPFWPVATA